MSCHKDRALMLRLKTLAFPLDEDSFPENDFFLNLLALPNNLFLEGKEEPRVKEINFLDQESSLSTI
jgi:hypothetical protein